MEYQTIHKIGRVASRIAREHVDSCVRRKDGDPPLCCLADQIKFCDSSYLEDIGEVNISRDKALEGLRQLARDTVIQMMKADPKVWEAIHRNIDVREALLARQREERRKAEYPQREKERQQLREKARLLLKKADEMRRTAGVNRGYNASRRSKIERMMIGRADALECKAYGMLDVAETEK